MNPTITQLSEMKLYSFYYHYNKPASRKAGKPQLSVHWRDVCYIVDKVVCEVCTITRNRNSQPHCVVAGKARKFTLHQNEAFLTLDL